MVFQEPLDVIDKYTIVCSACTSSLCNEGGKSLSTFLVLLILVLPHYSPSLSLQRDENCRDLLSLRDYLVSWPTGDESSASHSHVTFVISTTKNGRTADRFPFVFLFISTSRTSEKVKQGSQK